MSAPITILGPAFSTYVRSVILCCIRKGVEFRLEAPGHRVAELNPFQNVPVIEHDGLVLFETAAICRYIDRAFEGPALSPTGPVQLAWMDQWISVANCYFDPAIIRRYVLEYAFPKGEQGAVRQERAVAAEPDIKRHLGIMTHALSQHDYFSGAAPGIADFIIVPMLDYLTNGIVPTNLLAEWPVVERYLDGMRQLSCSRGVLGNPRWANFAN